MTTPTEEKAPEAPTGDCPHCENAQELRKKDGRVKVHKFPWGAHCPGSGK